MAVREVQSLTKAESRETREEIGFGELSGEVEDSIQQPIDQDREHTHRPANEHSNRKQPKSNEWFRAQLWPDVREPDGRSIPCHHDPMSYVLDVLA